MRRCQLIFFLAFSFFAEASVTAYPNSEVIIAFGSCNHQYESQAFWKKIDAEKPDIFAWLGDVIYADYMIPSQRRGQYEKLKKNLYYRQFIQNKIIIGTWDDHDFAYNNISSFYSYANEVQEMYLDFLEVPQTDPRRKRPGIHHQFDYGEGEKLIRFIVLDSRTFRRKSTRTFLGDSQWNFLKTVFQGKPAPLTLILSGTPVLSSYGEDGLGFYVKEQMQLEDLVANYPGLTIFVSGDLHYGEWVEKLHLGTKRKLFELTTSGLTHASTLDPNPLRVGPGIGGKNFGLIKVDFQSQIVKIQLKSLKKNNDLAQEILLPLFEIKR